MSDMRPYVVQQGDYLSKLAAQYGFDADVTWNHGKNKLLRESGRVPEMLQPLDILYIPEKKPNWLPVKAGQVNAFTASARKVTLSLRFTRRDGKPLANAKCTYNCLLPSKEMPPEQTDDAGALKFQVSTRQPPFVVTFALERYRFVINVGHMDPLSEASGVQKRLENLGYGVSPVIALGVSLGHWTAFDRPEKRIATFQRAQGIDPTGTADQGTLHALQNAHGS